MKLQFWGNCLFWLTLLVFVMESPAWCLDASRILLKDGTTYENVSFSINKRLKTVSIKSEDFKRNVSFTDINLIFDKDGIDVTEKYLGKYAEPFPKKNFVQPQGETITESQETWESETDPGHIEKQKPPWSVSIQTGLDFTIPTGDYYEGLRSGLGFGGDFVFAFSKNLGIRITVSKTGIRDDANEIASAFNSVLIEDQLDVSVWKYFLSMQYFNGPDWTKNKKVGFFAFGGLGAVNHSTSGALLVRDIATDSLALIFPLEKSQTKFAATSGFGIVTTVAPKFGFEFESTLDLLFIGATDDNQYNYPYGNVQTALILNFRGGIVFLI